jgi:hypothetical protein
MLSSNSPTLRGWVRTGGREGSEVVARDLLERGFAGQLQRFLFGLALGAGVLQPPG